MQAIPPLEHGREADTSTHANPFTCFHGLLQLWFYDTHDL